MLRVSKRMLYLSILVHVLILGFLQSRHRGRRRGRRRGGSRCNSGRCGSGSWLSEVTRGPCVRGNSHSTRRGVWASRITAEARRTPFNDESEFSCQQTSRKDSRLRLLPPTVSTGAPSVAGPAVHPLLHVGLVGASFVWKLLLLSIELRRVQPRSAARHPRSHRVTSRIHGIIAVCHRVPEHLESPVKDRTTMTGVETTKD